jgi:DNA (cytosine-5)-methyltransferase 1
MTYRSVCTGIAAETVAWHPLGWTPLSFSEIDPFCCSLLTHHYPGVRNYGDFTKIQAEGLESTDLLMGGTPCQSFSIAGKRAGLDDPRGNLALEFIRLAQRLRPRWLVWENVQGVLSIDEGRTFEAFLGALAQVGYGFAYRVLDAQFDALAQRRERVFVVGYLGDWRPPAAVLFERESLRRDTAPGRKAGQEVAGTIGGRAGEGGPRQDLDNHGAYIPILEAGARQGSKSDPRDGLGIGQPGDPMFTLSGKQHAVAYGGNNTTGPIDVATACRSKGGTGHGDFESETFVTCPLTSNHYGDHESRESLLVVDTLRSHPRPGSNSIGTIAFDAKQSGNDAGELAPTLRAMPHDKSHANGGGGVAVAFTERRREGGRNLETQEGLAYTLRNPGDGGGGGSLAQVSTGSAVRRLTPKEWERLMGFQDDYTLIPYPRLKLAADGPRYKAIGNSISVPTLRWIGRRIQTVEDILRALPSVK